MTTPRTRRAQPDKHGSTGQPPATPKAPQVKAASLRALFQEVAGEEATIAGVRQTVLDALGATTATKCVCPECGTEFRAKLPDVKKALDAAISVLEQLEGRPEQRAPEATKVVILRPPLPQ